jgi:hypothetical protein
VSNKIMDNTPDTVPAEATNVTTGTNITSAQQGVLDEHAAEIRRLGKRVIGDVLEIGRRLTEAKKQLGRAGFLPWIEREFGWSEDTAERFIALHALQRTLPQLAETSLPISALYLLASSSTPPAVEEVIAKAQAGERVSVAEVKATVERHKDAKGEDGKKRRAREPALSPEQRSLIEFCSTVRNSCKWIEMDFSDECFRRDNPPDLTAETAAELLPEVRGAIRSLKELEAALTEIARAGAVLQ